MVRIGTGTGTLNNDATAAFIETRQIRDGALSGSALALPIAVSGSHRALTLSGLASVAGQLSRSSDGKYLTLAGYAAAPGGKDISSSSSATYNRVVGRIDAAGTIHTATASTGFTASAMRGATTLATQLTKLSHRLDKLVDRGLVLGLRPHALATAQGQSCPASRQGS